ncbi:MAG: inorganic diphosphatase [Phycisphaerales bacterium]|nr:inorganic diphosphatase [Phycisphaerales bacterium]
MVHPWHDVTPASERGELPEHCKCIIEIPKGSNLKFELDKGSGLLKLDRVLSSAVYYPANYGFIPQTLAEDHDPLDILVYCTEEIPPLTLCNARAVGVMTMIDHGEPDHKIIAVLSEDPIYSEFKNTDAFPTHIFKLLRRFFNDYKALEGKEVEVDAIRPAADAFTIINQSLDRYFKARQRGAIKGLVQ